MATVLFKILVAGPKVPLASEFLQRFGFSSIEEWGVKVEALLVQYEQFLNEFKVMHNGITASGSFCLKIGIHSCEEEERVLNIFHTPGLMETLTIMSHHAMPQTVFMVEADDDYGIISYNKNGEIEVELPSFYKQVPHLPKLKAKDMKEYQQMMELWEERKERKEGEAESNKKDKEEAEMKTLSIPNTYATVQDGANEWTIVATNRFLSVMCDATNEAYTATTKDDAFKYEEETEYSSNGSPVDEIYITSTDKICIQITANPYSRAEDIEENNEYLDYCDEEYLYPAYICIINRNKHKCIFENIQEGVIPLRVAQVVQSVIKGEYERIKEAKSISLSV